jgi:antitoxin component YwqK of YwqJK toxin-antitoxin module
MKLNNLINRIKSINQNIRFVGEFDDNNLKTGYWENYYSNGNLCYKGNYLNGLRHGYWEVYYRYGNLMWKGNYINGIYYELK